MLLATSLHHLHLFKLMYYKNSYTPTDASLTIIVPYLKD